MSRDHFTNPDAAADVYEWLVRARRERVAAVLATVIEVTGSAPQVAGAKLLVRADGRIAGTVGGGAIERHVLEEAKARLAGQGSAAEALTVNLTKDLGMCCGGEMKIFFERVRGAERLIVFGGGHIGRALAETAARVGFEVTVVDQREEWARAERFPLATQVVNEEPEVVLPELLIDEASYCVVVTHDHPLDQALVKALLGSQAGFVGLVASRTKRNKFVMRLRAQGLEEDRLARLRSPLGLDVGAVTPEEIALSITAELVAVRRGLLPADASQAAGVLAVARRLGESS
jgi:xanthine dehydrogenase accessory factor